MPNKYLVDSQWTEDSVNKSGWSVEDELETGQAGAGETR